MRRRVFLAIGPLFAALLVVGVLLFTPLNRLFHYSKNELDSFAVSRSIEVYIGEEIKHQAFAQKEYLPLLGSSELGRFDPFHPSVLAKKYQRDYTPFLIGRPGTQSLVHYFCLSGLGEEMNGRKVVVILSPQWFECKKNQEGKVVSNGLNSMSFSTFVSMNEIYQWAQGASASEVSDRFLAQRLLAFPTVKENEKLVQLLTSLSEGKEPLEALKKYIALQTKFSRAEDSLFQKKSLPVSTVNLNRLASKLPAKDNVHELDVLAKQVGEKASSGNSFWINHHFWDTRIYSRFESLKGFQKHTNYLHGAEYNDFQLLLNFFAEHRSDVLFVIPPVNQRWTDYTGLSQSMLKKFAQKIEFQLNAQGFTRVVNYVERGGEPYFMDDTIHLGKRGWVALDQEIKAFMEKGEVYNQYRIDNEKFLSKEWLKVESVE